MSSRALRKLQREEEEKKRKQLQQLHEQDEDEGSEEGVASATKALNAFDMLNANEDEEPESEGGDEGDMILPTDQPDAAAASTEKSPPKKSKKKKNKKKGKEKEATKNWIKEGADEGFQLDEIDLALKSLSTKAKENTATTKGRPPGPDEFDLQLQHLLAVESKHLNALNEMKRLFGNVVLGNDNEDEAAAVPRRRGRGRGPRQLDLAGALGARNSPINRGQGLTGLALRRNFLIQGKEEWPKAAAAGLGMELVAKLDDGTTEYRFVHTQIYQDVQRQFHTCVESMDPQRMITMLIYNPYHVSTLLQVSEIAKQQGDHAVSGDLLERALFTFGRSVHSTFTNALSEGKARLNFDRPENREFWLAAWRYVNNLGQRGTWRTAYEWAKLILSLDPELDPYCMNKVIDQLALRGGQAEHLLALTYKCRGLWHREDSRTDDWHQFPNIAISSVLARYRLKQPTECRASLRTCIESYPWIFARLFQELNLDHIPKSIWGTTPRTPAEILDSETYVHLAKDLWNTPESISLLVEVAEYTTPSLLPTPDNREITLSEARHAILTGVPAIIERIPRYLTTQSTSSSDPLPPPENLPSYDPSPAVAQHARDPTYAEDSDDVDDPQPLPPFNATFINELPANDDPATVQSFFARFVPWLARRANEDAPSAPGPSDEDDSLEEEISEQEMAERERIFLERLNFANDRSVPTVGDVAETTPTPVGGEERPRSSPNAEARPANVEDGVQRREDAATAARATTTATAFAPQAEVSEEDLDERERELFEMLMSAPGAPESVPGDNQSARNRLIATLASRALAQRERQGLTERDIREMQASLHATYEARAEQQTAAEAALVRGEAAAFSGSRASATQQEQGQGEEAYDDDKNQRWLAGRGMLGLKAYTDSNGTDPTKWPADGAGKGLLRAYATRVLQLQRQKSLRYILDYALRQGAGNAVGDLIEKELDGLKK